MFSLSSIITIVSISVALILTIIIVIVIVKHRKMRDKLLRSRKLSKVTAGGVKVLPDYLFSPTPVVPDDSQCKVGRIFFSNKIKVLFVLGKTKVSTAHRRGS